MKIGYTQDICMIMSFFVHRLVFIALVAIPWNFCLNHLFNGKTFCWKLTWTF